MHLLASQTYYTMEKKIENNTQIIDKQEHVLALYNDHIQSSYQQLLLQEVFDVSYRRVTSYDYFLYLHTNRGVSTFQTNNDPFDFIKMFKEIKNNK
ncbi:hypothetical protein Pryu01_02318 [Paraliobacillus ryukyuensis]|uniref:Uncharacterized protein n=1 Tax=Paraliobacillus ryukyuensis TaxID=200904 RepID=A0A366DZ39_9BACI|nr:hypothetical protein [Paraliobacillus ryukyuensis]RBO94534.1 hypothetical protein DES48_11019 [Paraliobacillus ryukyuensis]